MSGRILYWMRENAAVFVNFTSIFNFYLNYGNFFVSRFFASISCVQIAVDVIAYPQAKHCRTINDKHGRAFNYVLNSRTTANEINIIRLTNVSLV